MKAYLRLLRVRHYIKNLLVFLPLFFGKEFFHRERLIAALLGFVSFCFLSSAVYILNDIRDVERDRQHPEKKKRPIASGEVSVTAAWVLFVLCVALAFGIFAIEGRTASHSLCLLAYLLLNVGYSMGLKDVPILDVAILASGFVLRVFYGGLITGIAISDWLYLVIVSGSLYLGLGKRHNERKNVSGESRRVLQFYTVSFLEKNMYVCMALANVFYALWAIGTGNPYLVWTVPYVLVVLMYYSLILENDEHGDPVEVIWHHPLLIVLGLLYAVAMAGMLYGGH